MKMKAAVLSGEGNFDYREVDKPEPAPADVLIRVKAVGICGTDMELYRGTMPFLKTGLSKYPIIPGHEWSGVVEEVGSEVTAFQPGDRVTGDVSIGCGRCQDCKRGLYNLCENRREVGITGGKDGAYAQFLLMPEPFVYKVPDNVSFDAAALTEPAATMVKAIRKTPVPLGDVVLVMGAGPIGLLGLACAISAGAGFTIAADRKKPKLEVAKKLGADIVVNVLEEDLADVVGEATEGKGVDYLIEASGSTEACTLASSLVRGGGVINAVGIYEGPLPNYNMADVVLRDISVIGSVASPNAYEATIRLMASGRIRPELCISHRFGLSEIDEAIEVQEEDPDNRLKILLYP